MISLYSTYLQVKISDDYLPDHVLIHTFQCTDDKGDKKQMLYKVSLLLNFLVTILD